MKHARGPDVVVVGAGPAGALAAVGLARAGRRVLLVDRASFPRDKVCGGCLQPAALRALEAAGLGSLVARCGGRELRELVLHAGPRVAAVALEGGAAISRRTLDAALVTAAAASGAEVRTGVRARLGPACAGGREVFLEHDGRRDRVVADLVLDASGLGGGFAEQSVRVRARSLMGAGAIVHTAPVDCPDGTVRMATASGGYVGTVCVEERRTVFAAAVSPRLVRRAGGLAGAVARILGACGLEAPPAGAAWQGTPLLTRRPARLWTERVLVLGDAAGYVEPFTGEGMAWAMRSANAVAAATVDGWRPDLGRHWERLHRITIGGRQRNCRALTLALRAPWLVRAVVRLLAHAPGLATPLVRSAALGNMP